MTAHITDLNAGIAGDGKPFRRRVFYIPGYDPIHPRRYRELYRKEGAAQAAVAGYRLTLTPKKGEGPYGWAVNSEMEDAQAQADIDVLVWSDIVRGSMDGGIAATYVQLLRTAWVYVGSGALFRLMRLRKGPILAALYPIVMLLAQLGLAVLAAWICVRFTTAAVDFRGAGLVGSCLGLGAAWLILRWFRAKDNKLFAYYLMHDYAYSAQSNGAVSAGLAARMLEFEKSIRDAMTKNYDEVLVVGHSSGAHLAVSILADLIRNGLPAARPALAFLSLGQVMPMVSFLPHAQRLRGDLHFLAARGELTWIDVTAPGDGCAFALCDPVAVTGVSPPGKRWPLVISAAFTQTLSPARWRSLRWRFFRLHFQYLCAFDCPGHYDYFRITAGPITLAARYAGRAPSKSRLDRSTSGFTDW